MAVTKSWEQQVRADIAQVVAARRKDRRVRGFWLLATSLAAAAGLALVFFAKTQDFPDQQARLNRGELLNLNTEPDAQRLLPFLADWRDAEERQLAAEKVADFLHGSGPLPNVGALARLRMTRNELESDSRWSSLKARLDEHPGRASVALLAVAKLKPLLVVRTPAQFRRQYVEWMGAYFAAFLVVWLVWRWRGFAGDPSLLPALQLLTAMGLILAVSLKDPLRDTLEFRKFAWGVAAGCLLLLLPLLRPFASRDYSKLVYTPLLAAFALFALLLRFGSGPTGSDARVNLGPFQPVEVIKVLLVFFMAGYFARRWEWLRELRETRVPKALRWLRLPRFAHALPVMCAVAGALSIFFWLKDLGPALVIGFLFLTMFAVARGKAGLALAGVVVLVAGVAIGYHYRTPQTVVQRIEMWQSPWDNEVRGGDQLAHSLWAFATGGPLGSGPGWGDPGMIPAGHTDLVLSAIGEEWGFVGVATVGLLFVWLVGRLLRLALRSANDYAFFLALGFATLIALEMLLISGGVLGAIPLSGVVSPFLSSGNTAMLANFLIFALALALCGRNPAEGREGGAGPFRKPVRILGVVLVLAAGALLAKAASIQMFHDTELIARESYVIEDDGHKRPQRNPRLTSLARELTRGTIYDRNGLPLATSAWSELESHRAEYEKLGISIEAACSRLDDRCYPLGPALAQFLGDVRTGENFHATNASLVEHDANITLQGFADYRDLAAMVRYRHQPGNAAVARLRGRDRSVHTTIDARLEMRAAEILSRRLAAAGKNDGALAVLNPQTGDMLALVSVPYESLDRARYGLYPPGSTFKLVTAIAALRVDPKSKDASFHCARLRDGRAGTMIPGWNRPVRDDVGDAAHGTLTMARAIQVSCNAYFAQLGVYRVGAQALHDTAALMGISTGELPELKKMLPFAAYGQGPVVISPFKMARVAATIADGGEMPEGRWILDAANSRRAAPSPILPAEEANFLAGAMRAVVTGGTARHAMAGLDVAVAGKTGTAQVEEGLPHSWFAGFAPADAPADQRIAFAVVVEHGGYGAQTAAPIARELVEAARDLGIIRAGTEGGK
ncbi:MAG: FtsW/RodA/SpoVE family cell cycle protein [Bryobacteraceae bacterium]|jgi:cell division protein FtsW (lipid II flippase)/cell division protein FtsI/penicillin-binding protein 2